MKIGVSRSIRRFFSLAVVGVLIALLSACTGRGGGQLPPDTGFTGQAAFGFDFSCQDSGGLNPPTGKLQIELAYADRGTSLWLGAPFSIHGIVDQIDPVLESAICIGQNPPPGGNELIFLGRYYLTSSAPAGFPSTCPTRQTATKPLCRFEVIVRDNDGNLAPSPGDYFKITLSTGTAVTSKLEGTLFYTRGGFLSAGNLTVN